MYVGCVGSRELTPTQLEFCRRVSTYLAKKGHSIVTGGANGADQAFAAGAARAGGRVVVCLPWPRYEREHVPDKADLVLEYTDEEWELAARCHPAWNYLKDSVRKLMVRNAAIVIACERIVAWPRRDREGRWAGGTAHTLRCAVELKKPIVDLTSAEELQRLAAELSRHGC